MQLVRLLLHNFRIHKDLEIDFQPIAQGGLLGIVGPNGSGKSTIVSAIHAFLTGDFRRLPGTRQEQVSQLADADDESYGELTIAHHGRQAVIRRSFRPQSRTLAMDGQLYTREKDIAYHLENSFNLTANLAGEYLFVAQRELLGFLDQTPANRMKSLHTLFRLDQVEKCYHILGEHLLSLPALPALQDEDKLKQEKDAAIQALAGLVEQLKPLPHENPTNILLYLKKVNTQLAKQRELIRVKINHDNTLKHLAGKLEEAHREEAEIGSNRGVLQAALPVDELTQLRQQQEGQVRRQQILSKLSDIGSSIIDLEITLDDPQIKATYEAWTKDLEEQLVSCRNRLYALDKFLSAFDPDTGDAQCPTCGTQTTQLSGRYNDYKLEYHTVVQPEFARLIEAKEQWQAELDASGTRERERGHCQGIRDALLEDRDLLTEELLNYPVLDIDKLFQRVQYLEGIQQSLQVLEYSWQTAQREVTFLQDRWQEAELRSLQLVKEILPGLEELEQAAVRMEAELPLAQLRLELEVQQTSWQLRLQQAEAGLIDLETIKQQIAKEQSWRQRISYLREEVFHRDHLPAQLTKKYLQSLEGLVARYLEGFGASFRVSTDEDLNFRAHFNDGRDVQADALSGGEQVIFALSWRLAIHSAFAGSIGLLCLDEPTAGLDKERLDQLRKGLIDLRTMAASTGLQCLIITHDSSFMPLFDQIVQLQCPLSSERNTECQLQS